jgi:hypothetical protein
MATAHAAATTGTKRTKVGIDAGVEEDVSVDAPPLLSAPPSLPASGSDAASMLLHISNELFASRTDQREQWGYCTSTLQRHDGAISSLQTHTTQLQQSFMELSKKFDTYLANTRSQGNSSTGGGHSHPTLTRAESADSHLQQTQQADPTVVRVSAKDAVGRDAVLTKINELATEAGIKPTEYELKPKLPVSTNYRLVFCNGDARLGKAVADNFLTSLKINDSTWKPTEITRPRGGGTERLYISKDRTKSDIARQRNSKILFRLLDDTFPNKGFAMARSVVTVDWITVASLSPEDGFTSIKWTNTATTEGINTQDIDTRFAEALSKFNRPPAPLSA